MAQRLSRAKETIRTSGVRFAPPTPAEQKERLATVLQVLYLVFNEGYAATSGDSVHRVDLSAEAIRVARLLAAAAKDEPEVKGLLALMLLTDARRDARVGPHGELVPLDEQDRTRWNRAAIAEGIALLDSTLDAGLPGPYRIQAAIAALHDEAPSTETTDWAQIHALYGVLLSFYDNPMVHLSRAIALSMVQGPREGLAALDELENDPRLAGSHRLDAARAHLLERTGDREGAVRLYERAVEHRGAQLPSHPRGPLAGACLAARSARMLAPTMKNAPNQHSAMVTKECGRRTRTKIATPSDAIMLRR